MSSTSSQYYGVIKKVSSWSGQWPYQTSKTRLFRMSVVTLSAFSMIIPQIFKFIKCEGDLQCVCETLTSYILMFAILLKLYTCSLNRYKMKTLVDRFFVDWDKLEIPEEYEIMKKYAENSRRFSIGYSLFTFISLCLFMCISLIPQLLDVILPLNESRPIVVPYPGYYFVDEQKYFLFIFCHSIMASEIAITGFIAHDCMLLSCVEHACSIFAVTGFRFERLTYTKAFSAHPNDAYCKRIALVVHMHQKAVKFCQFLENVFSLSLGIQVLLNTVIISVTLLQIAYQKGITLETLRYVIYFAGQLIHLFYLSFEGQKLIDHSLQVRDKIYNGSWYKLPMKPQKLMLLVMRKSCRPCCISAGKMYIFSMAGFCTILQASMSYFTMLSSFQ